MGVLRGVDKRVGNPGSCVWPILVVLLGATLVVSGAETSPFAELPTGHWTYDALSHLSGSGLVDVDSAFLQRVGYEASRYEMAVWVSQALTTLGDDLQDKQHAELSALVAGYNRKNGSTLTSDDTEALKDLVLFLRPELSDLGYSFSALADEEIKLIELGMTGAGVLRLTTGSVTTNSSRYSDQTPQTPRVGLGLSLDLGDVLLRVGRSAGSTHEGKLDSTTELGVNVRLQNMSFKVGYSTQGETSGNVRPTAGSKHTTSAGVEYVVTPAGWASADVSYSADPASNMVTTNLGLKYNQDGTSVTLGYRVMDFTETFEGMPQESRDNVATAEFTIRF